MVTNRLLGAPAVDATRAGRDVLRLVDLVRGHQQPDGAVRPDATRPAAELLAELVETLDEAVAALGMPDPYADAVLTDLRAWLAGGVQRPPSFDRSLAAYRAPADGETTFFLGCLRTPNGPPPRGYFLESFVAIRDEPVELDALRERFTSPRRDFMCLRLVCGSKGFVHGNCLVFFPENVLVAEPLRDQSFAGLFVDKFCLVYSRQTLPNARKVFPRQRWKSAELDPSECSRCRAILGYLHDFHHEQGGRPLSENLDLKSRFYPAVLDEARVDCQAALAALDSGAPLAFEVLEAMLLERLVRFPCQPDWDTNVDAAAGLMLFEWLHRRPPALEQSGEGLAMNLSACVEALRELVVRVERLDSSTVDPSSYVEQAQALVTELVPTGEGAAKISKPEAWATLVAPAVGTPDLPRYDEFLSSPG